MSVITTIVLSEEILNKLDKEIDKLNAAPGRKTNRSEFIRDLIDSYFKPRPLVKE